MMGTLVVKRLTSPDFFLVAFQNFMKAFIENLTGGEYSKQFCAVFHDRKLPHFANESESHETVDNVF